MTNRHSKKPKQGSNPKARRNHASSEHARHEQRIQRAKRFKAREA